MAYIAPIHRPSSVRHALQIQLEKDAEPSLVLAKSNRLEVWQPQEGRLVLVRSTLIFGSIVMLKTFKPVHTDHELLFVGTDRFRYFTAEWDPAAREFNTVQVFEDIGDSFVRDVPSRNMCLVDPNGGYVAMLLWSGVIHVTYLMKRRGVNEKHLRFEDQARISELFIKDATFLYSDTGHPRLAFLYQPKPNQPESTLVTYRLYSDDDHKSLSRFELKDREMTLPVPDPGASMLIPVKRPQSEKRHNFRTHAQPDCHLGGIIVVGESELLYIDDLSRHQITTKLNSPMVFVAWAKRQNDDTTYFLADDFGGLHLLTILCRKNTYVVEKLQLTKISKTSRASELVMLDGGYLFVASHFGDSQLFRVDIHATQVKDMVELVQIMPSIAPILDFTVMDMGNREGDSQLGNEYSSGQARIVAGSGAHKDGSLRSVRSGVGLEDVGIISDELENIKGLFPQRSHGSDQVDTLVVSFLTDTRVFKFDAAEGVEEVEEFQGLDLSLPSLLVTELADGNVLQITEAEVRITDPENGMIVTSWELSGGEAITHGSANERWVLLSVDGKTLVSLRLDQELMESARKNIEQDQISCLNVSPHLLDTGAVGLWVSGSVSIVELATLDAVETEKIRRSEDDSAVAREVLLARVLPNDVANPTLFVSKDDGEVMTFTFNNAGKLGSRKSVVLGTREAKFHVLPQSKDICSIFVTTEHSSLIYGSERRIVYSAVTGSEPPVYVCPFDAAVFPEALAVATATQLKISRIDKQRQSHIQSLHVGENVRSLAYSSTEKVFGLGCIKRTLEKGVEKVTGSFRLVDEVVFDNKGKPFPLQEGEVPECVTRARLLDSYGEMEERFIVGTRFLDGNVAGGEHLGRLLVMGVDEKQSPYQLISHPLKSGCRRVAVMENNLLVVALTKTVVLARYEELSSTSGRLVRLASYQTASYAMDVAVEGRFIAVADIMKSMALVEYVPASTTKVKQRTLDGEERETENNEPAKLVEICRDFQSLWSMAVSHVDENSWLVADADGNLVVLARNTEGLTLEDKRRMQITSEFGLGETVNRIHKIAVETGANTPITPRAFLSTTEGAIYLFGTVAPKFQNLLMKFQENLVGRIETLGNIQFETWRCFRNGEREGDGPHRFLDGDFLERFLDMDEQSQEEVCEGLGPSVEDMRNLVEELKNMH